MSSASPVSASRFPERERCPKPGCKGSIAWEARDCSVCSHSIAPPNVRWAQRERGDLDRRYDTAMAALRADGCEAIAMAYETALAGSMAVFATSLDYAIALTDLRPHQNYHHGVDGGSRWAAKAPNDVMRRTVDAMLFEARGRRSPWRR